MTIKQIQYKKAYILTQHDRQALELKLLCTKKEYNNTTLYLVAEEMGQREESTINNVISTARDTHFK